MQDGAKVPGGFWHINRDAHFISKAVIAPNHPLEIRLEASMPDKTRYFILKDNKIVLADKPDNQITFRVLDADWGRVNESEPIMKPVSDINF